MIPGLTRSTIRAYSSDQSFARGENYYRSGAVRSVQKRDGWVDGRVAGSSAELYRVDIRPDPSDIPHAICSCPYDWGGWCKHIVAVMLVCLEKPAEVTERKSLTEKLQKLNKNQLIELVQHMVDTDYDLGLLVDATILSSSEPDADKIRPFVKSLIRSVGHEWRASARIADGLHKIISQAEMLAKQNRWLDASAVYVALIEIILDEYSDIHDAESEVAGIVLACTDGLGECLETLDNPIHRKNTLRVLFDLFKLDISWGGYGLSDNVPEILLEQTSAEEKKQVVSWLRSELMTSIPKKSHYWGSWTRESIGVLLLDLEKETLDDDAYLEVCRANGLWEDLIERLLKLDRTDEAIEAMMEVPNTSWPALANRFTAHGKEDLIAPIIRKKAKEPESRQLLEWLQEFAETRGLFEEAAAVCVQRFWYYPTQYSYATLKRLMRRHSLPETYGATIKEKLLAEEKYLLLAELHLEDGEIEQTLQQLGNASIQAETDSRARRPSIGLLLQTARAASKTHPMEALDLFLESAEAKIDERNRKSYAEAAKLLIDVRDMCRQSNMQDVWKETLKEIKEHYKRMSAFLDELKKAGL